MRQPWDLPRLILVKWGHVGGDSSAISRLRPTSTASKANPSAEPVTIWSGPRSVSPNPLGILTTNSATHGAASSLDMRGGQVGPDALMMGCFGQAFDGVAATDTSWQIKSMLNAANNKTQTRAPPARC